MELKDYLHFYLPVPVELNNGGSKVYNRIAVAIGNTDDEYRYVTLRHGKGKKSFTHSIFLNEKDRIKPILRPLSDMTEDEESEIEGEWGSYGMGGNHLCNALKDRTKYVKDIHEMPGLFLYLLSRHFDLFGLIDANLAIDKTKQ